MSVGYPSVVDLSWRVDVSLSTSRTNRVLRPYVLLRIETDAGKPPLIFEVPRDRFDELRYAVSRALNEVARLEKNDRLASVAASSTA